MITKEPTAYPHPSDSKIIFWDLPGIGGMSTIVRLIPVFDRASFSRDEGTTQFRRFQKSRLEISRAFREIDLICLIYSN